MCPHGYHHNGFMATPALGTQEVRLHIVWTALWSHQSAQTVNSEQCIVQKVNVPRGGSSPNPRECSNCLGSGRNIQRITMCPHGYHHNGFMATSALGTQEVTYMCIRMFDLFQDAKNPWKLAICKGLSNNCVKDSNWLFFMGGSSKSLSISWCIIYYFDGHFHCVFGHWKCLKTTTTTLVCQAL